jgi:cell division protease FtsH
VEAQYQRAIALLEEHKDKLTELANELLEKEVIFKESLERIFGPRPFAVPEPAEPAKLKEDISLNNSESDQEETSTESSSVSSSDEHKTEEE